MALMRSWRESKEKRGKAGEGRSGRGDEGMKDERCREEVIELKVEGVDIFCLIRRTSTFVVRGRW